MTHYLGIDISATETAALICAEMEKSVKETFHGASSQTKTQSTELKVQTLVLPNTIDTLTKSS